MTAFWSAVPFVAAGWAAIAILGGLLVGHFLRAVGNNDAADLEQNQPPAQVIRGPWQPRPVSDDDLPSFDFPTTPGAAA